MPKPSKLLPAVRPNAGLEAVYRQKLRKIIEEMARSYRRWIEAAYRANEPAVMALDATPAQTLEKLLKQLGKKWEKRFDKAALELAAYFAKSAHRRSDAQLRDILKRAGLSVDFKMNRVMRDIMNATLAENVGLIRSIPQEYHTQVQGMVMRSVSAGRDLKTLSRDLRHRYGVSYKRAALIARDQNNKATSVMTRARQVDIGFDQGVWIHSHAGKVPRKTHLANDQNKFNLREGWFDPDPKVRRRILPGELINCRCTWRPVMKGLS